MDVSGIYNWLLGSTANVTADLDYVEEQAETIGAKNVLVFLWNKYVEPLYKAGFYDVVKHVLEVHKPEKVHYMAFSVETLKFEGPLDLMLHLIREQELDIFDLDMSILTEQYIEYYYCYGCCAKK